MKFPDSKPVKKKVKFVLPKEETTAAEASFGSYYWTAQSSWVDKPENKVLAMPVGIAPHGGIVLRNWNPLTQEWLDTPVQGNYKLIPIKEGTVKIPSGNKGTSDKPKAVKEPKVSKRLKNQVGVTSKKGPDETWGIALKKFSTPRQIVEYMHKEFPTVTKKWESWVNHFRQLYNNGKLGQPAPKEPIPMFGGKRSK
jgi:hypothetical protein